MVVRVGRQIASGMPGSAEQQAQGDGQAVDKDVAGGLSQAGVQLASLPYLLHAQPGEHMQHEVEQRKDRGQRMAVGPEDQPHEAGDDAHAQVELDGGLCANAGDERELASLCVGVAVAEVVHQQQGVDDQAACQRGDDDRGRDGVQLHIVGDADGYDAEEHEHEQVAQPHVGQVGGVEEAE